MDNWNQFEAMILLWIQENIRTDWLDGIMPLISLLNNAGMLAIFMVIVLLVWRKYRHVGLTATSSLFVEFLLVNVLIKNSIHRTRPYFVNEELILLGDMPSDFSFPSGHTGAAFAVAVVMFLCMPRKYGVSAIVIASLIAVSRIYNGAHYPTDVLAGLLVAMMTGIAAWKFVFPKALKYKE